MPRVTSLSAATADETLGTPLNARGMEYISAYVEGTGTISGGVITIEEASYEASTTYAGTWSELETVDASMVTGGAQLAVHLQPGAYGFIRARVSTAITGGGSVSVYLEGGE
jgi:hypothetical protein